jgi:hypothetical protein
MSNESIDPKVAAMADKIDAVLRGEVLEIAGYQHFVPALAICLGRYIAFEAGAANRSGTGLEIVCKIALVAAINEATKLYGPNEGGQNEGKHRRGRSQGRRTDQGRAR